MESHGIKFGFFAGIGTVLILLSAYFIEKKLMLSPSVVWSTLIFYLIGMYMAAYEDRKSQGGFISFKAALRSSFLVWIIANAIYHVFMYLHFNFFDVGMLDIQKEYFLEMNEQAGLLNDDLSEQISDQLSYDLMQTLTGYTMSLIGGFALSAIIARLIRKDDFAKHQNP